VIRAFKSDFDISVLSATPLSQPPDGQEILLMWCQEAYSLQHSPNKRNEHPLAATTSHKANDNQTYLHAQWRHLCLAEAIDKMYLEWPLCKYKIGESHKTW
jgi:hypothetical protein